jgi:hypothetical protein
MHLIIDKLISGAIVPDWQILLGPILHQKAEKVKEKLRLKGLKVTFQTDG